jgi:predicted transcriptional regulator
MTSNKKRTIKREREIIQSIENNEGIKIKDLAKLLEMWDSNLRKMIKILVEQEKVEKFRKDNYICVRIKKR